MPYDEGLAQRLRETLAGQDIVEKKMFGGLAFMLQGNMSCGVSKNTLMLRVGPATYDSALSQPHARPMDFTGKPLKGFVYVDPPGFAEDEDLAAWVKLSTDFALSLPAK